MEDSAPRPLLDLNRWTPRRTMAATLVVLLVVFAFFLLYRYRLVVFSLFEAIVFGTAILPAVDWLNRKGLPRMLGVVLIFVLFGALLAFFIVQLVPLIGEQGAAILRTVEEFYRGIYRALSESPSILIRRLSWRLPQSLPTGLPAGAAQDTQSMDTVTHALTMGGSIARGIFTSGAVLLLTAYWAMDRERVLRWFFLLFPIERRDSAREFYAATEQKVGQYIRGLGLMCLVIGVASFVAYLVIGLPNTLLLGMVAGLMEAVPLVGPTLGAIPAILVALSFSPDKVIWVIVAHMVIQTLENNLLVPRVMERTVGINAIVSLLAFVAFSSLFGLAGALLAIPLAVVVQLVISRLVFEPSTASAPQPAGRDSISKLRYEAQELVMDVRKQVRDKEGLMDKSSDRVEDAIEAVVNDLDSILAQEEAPAAESGADQP